ncbi:MFS transporter [Azospirillum doebereinerae]|uniref:MFS transporter n=1 Tax=Azospirillum doebereinerae TaxID=92933 RepID=UPI001EE5D960|nr:MFS transporter [Azospirillum doebereinerae]MCG5243630.1 MFS transporter [Azospirillum doebereinerae]
MTEHETIKTESTRPSAEWAPAGWVKDDGGWRVRFYTILGGQALSLIGSALTQFVLIWWITDTTGSITALTAAGMAALLPQAVLGPLGGIFADRYSRRLLMITADGVSALCMLVLIALFLTDRIELWHALVMMAIRSAMQGFQEPAMVASTPMLVPGGFLVRAVGLEQSVHSLTLVAAAPLGALAIAVMPLGWALAIDVVTAVLGIAPLLLFRIPQAFAPDGGKAGLWWEFREGVEVVWGTPGLRQLFLLLGGVVLAFMPVFTLVPLLVKEHFGGDTVQLALMESLSGIGMGAGGLLVVVLAPRRRMPWILCGFAVSCGAMALTALAPRGLFGVAVAWWVVSGLAFVVADAPLTTVLQTIVPNHLLGRVMSLMNTVMGLAAPVGLGLLTPLGELFGVRGMFIVAGMFGVAISVSGFLSRPLMALDRRRLETDQECQANLPIK